MIFPKDWVYYDHLYNALETPRIIALELIEEFINSSNDVEKMQKRLRLLEWCEGAPYDERIGRYLQWYTAFAVSTWETFIAVNGIERVFEFKPSTLSPMEAVKIRGVELFPELSSKEFTAICKTAWASAYFMARYVHAGRKTYQVTEELAKRLASSTLEGIRADSIEMPAHTVLIHNIPESLQFCSGSYTVSFVCVAQEENSFEGGRGRLLHASIGINGANIDDFRCVRLFLEVDNDPTLETWETHKERTIIKDTLRAHALSHWLFSVILYATFPGSKMKSIAADKHSQELWEKAARAPAGSSKKKRFLDEYNRRRPLLITLLG